MAENRARTVVTVHRGRHVRPPSPWRRALRAATAAVTVLALASLPGAASPALADGPSPVSLSMTPSASTVPSGTSLTYTYTVGNPGGEAVDDAVLTSQLNGLTNVVLTSNAGSCSQSFQTITCDAGTLSGSTQWVVTARGTVTASHGVTLTNGAVVTVTKSSQTFTSSTSTQVLVGNAPTGPLPDLSISVTAPSSATSPFTDKITVNNTGGRNATDVRVYVTLPNGFSATGVGATSLFACSTAVVGRVVCDGGAVNAGANATISLTLTGTGAPSPAVLTTAVDPYDAIAELNELNNTASAQTTLAAAPASTSFSLAKTYERLPASPTGQLRPGDVLRYTIVGKNVAATRADSIAITDSTQGLDQASIKATTTKGACTVANNKVTCTQASPVLRLEPQETMTVTITGTVVAPASSLLINTATITGNIKNKGYSQSATVTTTVRPGVDLTVTQRSVCNPLTGCERGTFRAHDQFDYVITVGNSGLNDASEVLVREPLPAGTVLEGFTAPPGVSCGADAPEGGVVSCTGLTVPGVETSGLAGGAVRVVVLHLTAPNAIGTITSTVTVDPNNAIYEADETNNTATTSTAVATGIDLTVTKAALHDPVAPSGTEVYTIVASNIGTQDVQDVVLKDTLPAGTRYREAHAESPTHDVTCSHDGAATAGTVTCVGADLLGTYSLNGNNPIADAPVDQVTIKVTVFAPAPPGSMANVVLVDPDNRVPEIVETNNTNRIVTGIAIPPAPGGGSGTFHDFQISKTHSPAVVVPSGSLTYTLTVRNVGSDVAFGVVLKDALPTGSVFRSAADTQPGPGAFTCSAASGTVTCVGGTLDGTADQTAMAGDQLRTVVVSVFAPTQPADYTNQAVVDPANALPEANETDNSATDTTTVAMSGQGSYQELTIAAAQSLPAGPVVPSGNLEYAVTVGNTGTDVAYDTVVRVELPDGVVFRSAQDTAPGANSYSCAAAGQVVTCSGGDLDGSGNQLGAGAADSQRVIKVLTFAPTQPGTYTVQAAVDPSNAVAEADETNNTATAQTSVSLSGSGGYVDLKLVSDGPATAPRPGQVFSYLLTVSNLGTDAAFDVSLRDALPTGATFVSATDGGGFDGAFACSASGGIVDCSGGALDGSSNQTPDPGDSTRTILVTVRAPLQHGVTLINQAKVDPANTVREASEINNTTSASTTVLSQVNLTITKTGPGSATQSSTPSYTLKVKNNAVNGAGETAKKVVVRDPLPVGMIPLNVLTPGTSNTFQCQVEENPINVVTCVGDLAPGEEETIEIEVFITAESGKTLDNVGTVDPDNTVIESSDNDNSSAAQTVIGDADLTLDKDDLYETVAPGQEQVYTLSVSNIGSATAEAVTITDDLPSDVTFVSATGTNGFTCTGAPNLSCTNASSPDLAPNQATVITVTVNVSETASQSISNTASVSTTSSESVTDNNTSSVTTAVGGSGIDLVVGEITDTPDPAPIGSVVTYRYGVTNTGTAKATGVVVRNTFTTTNTSVVSATASEGFSCSGTGGTRDCSGSLLPGHTTLVEVKLQVGAGATGKLTFTATADPGATVTETNENNNTQTTDTTVSTTTCQNCIDLVTSGTSNPTSVSKASSTSVAYNIVVSNAGDLGTADDTVKLTVPIPAELTTGTMTGTAGFTCSVPGTLPLRWVCVGELEPTEGATFTYTAGLNNAALTPGTDIVVSANATVTPQPPAITFNTANDSTQVHTAVTA